MQGTEAVQPCTGARRASLWAGSGPQVGPMPLICPLDPDEFDTLV